MKRFFTGVVALALLITPTFATAAAPVELSDSEMDNVTAGALLNVTVKNNDIIEDNEIIKNVDVAAALTVAAQVLSAGQAAGSAAKISK
jgi:hypothetical protein